VLVHSKAVGEGDPYNVTKPAGVTMLTAISSEFRSSRNQGTGTMERPGAPRQR